MIANEATGDLKPEMLGSGCLSAIIEIQVGTGSAPRHPSNTEGGREGGGQRLLHRRLHCGRAGASRSRRSPGEHPGRGFTWRPNAKINMGLGRAWNKDNIMTHSLHREGSLIRWRETMFLFIYPARDSITRKRPEGASHGRAALPGGPVNLIPTSLRRNMYSGVRPEEILESITVEERASIPFQRPGEAQESADCAQGGR